LWSALVPPFLLATGVAAAGPCDPFSTVGFFPLLPVVSALVAAAIGTVVGRLAHGWPMRILLGAMAIAGVALWTVWPLLWGPQIFVYSHLGGYIPGPLYDEELRIPAALFWFRLGSLCLVATCAGVGALLVPRRSESRVGAGLLSALSLTSMLIIEWNGSTLGFRMTDASLRNILSGLRETPQVALHYHDDLPPEDVALRFADVRFRYSQIAEFFGEAPPGKVHVWLYRHADEKRKLVGAAHTQFAKPWRREVHLNDTGFPHSVLKHELAHAMAAPWGAPPFGVTAGWFGLFPQMGIVEGLAVAADNPPDDLTLHEWAAAMKQRGLLPPLRDLLGPSGFYGSAASRAYTAAGSFLRWLSEQHGPDKLRRLYLDGDFEGAYGRTLDSLVEDYEMFLDGATLEPEALNQAAARFKRGSIFERPCAREVARILSDAAALAQSDPTLALLAFERCLTIQPREPGHALGRIGLLRRLKRTDEARTRLDELLKALEAEPAPWADAAMARADLALEHDDTPLARTMLEEVIQHRASAGHDRSARLRLASLDLPETERKAIAQYFAPGRDDEKLDVLRRAATGAGTSPYLAYLLGRRLALDGQSREALEWLDRALESALPESLKRESARLLIEASFGAERCDLVEAIGQRRDLGAGVAAKAADWTARCAQRKREAKPI
jgi:tetratricopeptide (TPR) repeat protein